MDIHQLRQLLKDEYVKKCFGANFFVDKERIEKFIRNEKSVTMENATKLFLQFSIKTRLVYLSSVVDRLQKKNKRDDYIKNNRVSSEFVKKLENLCQDKLVNCSIRDNRHVLVSLKKGFFKQQIKINGSDDLIFKHELFYSDIESGYVVLTVA